MGLRMNIFMKLFINNNIFFHLSPTPNHLHPLQVENCDSNSQLVVDEGDNGKFRLERVKALNLFCINHGDQMIFFNLKLSQMSLLFVFRFI